MQDDSIEGIYSTLKRCAQISKAAGGVGLSVSNIRAGGSYIRGTNGTSNGLLPMLRVYNNTARFVNQGGGKRQGSFAMYLEPWHADVFAFLDLKKNHGKEESRARDLFYALWVRRACRHRACRRACTACSMKYSACTCTLHVRCTAGARPLHEACRDGGQVVALLPE